MAVSWRHSIAFWLLFVWTILMLAALLYPFSTPKEISEGIRTAPSYTDKLAHFIMFFVFGALSVRPAESITKSPIRVLSVVLFGIILGALTEGFQYFIAGRSTSIADLLSDAAGVLGGALVALLMLNLRANRRPRK